MPTLHEMKSFDTEEHEYDRAHAELSAVEQLSPCTCQIASKLRTGSALFPSIPAVDDLDPECELHFPWVIEDERTRRGVMRYWMTGYQVGFDTALAGGQYEIVDYDPEDEDTFPSVCAHPEEVKARFGFTGGEKLLFNLNGAYIGQLVKQIGGE